MTVEYNATIEAQILSHLDGWVIESVDDDSADASETVETNATAEQQNGSTTSASANTGEVQPFITDITEYADNPNKKVTSAEVERFYDVALQKSYAYTNRLNVADLSSLEEQTFIEGVCLLTASDLWNKYNIRVNNEDMEDTYVQSYGGLLYKQALNTLHPFINQRVFTLTSLKAQAEQCNNRNNGWFL